jgi:hypothetical protein
VTEAPDDRSQPRSSDIAAGFILAWQWPGWRGMVRMRLEHCGTYSHEVLVRSSLPVIQDVRLGCTHPLLSAKVCGAYSFDLRRE